MGAHLIDGEFQSDKYPTCPRGKVPLSVKDLTAQDLLWEYAQRRRPVDREFSDDLEAALKLAGFIPPHAGPHCTCGANTVAAGHAGIMNHTPECAFSQPWIAQTVVSQGIRFTK